MSPGHGLTIFRSTQFCINFKINSTYVFAVYLLLNMFEYVLENPQEIVSDNGETAVSLRGCNPMLFEKIPVILSAQRQSQIFQFLFEYLRNPLVETRPISLAPCEFIPCPYFQLTICDINFTLPICICWVGTSAVGQTRWNAKFSWPSQSIHLDKSVRSCWCQSYVV